MMAGRALRAYALVIALILVVVTMSACRGGDGGREIVIPHGAIDLDAYTFSSHLELSTAQGEADVAFEGALQSPDRIKGLVTADGTLAVFDHPSGSEVASIGTDVWWKEPGADWQRSSALGESLDGFVLYSLYATPRFYLQSLSFDSLRLTSSASETLDGVKTHKVHLDRDAILAALDQGSFIAEEDGKDPSTIREDAANTLPDDMVIEAWLADDGLWPVRIVVTLTSDENDGFALLYQEPLDIRLQLDITDPHANIQIEPPTP